MPKQPNANSRKLLYAKFNDLYIQTRSKYLVQFPDRYVTVNKKHGGRAVALNDSMLVTHLDGKLTYGIFNGGYFNKFITFDVDFNDAGNARWAALKLIDVLVREFRINHQDIHVSLSGSKGYHIDLFFDKPVPVREIRAFFEQVIATVGALPDGQIEFRPSWTQGVKLPLGIHQRTGNRCWFVDNETLAPIKSFGYLLDVQPMDASIITDADFGLTEEQASEFEAIATETNIMANVVDQSAALQKARRILEAGRLTESNTRHSVTFALACFYNSQGFEQVDAVEAIMDILTATPREYFSADSKPEYWLKEAERLVAYAYEKDIKLGNADKPVRIYKSEILAVLSCGAFKRKQMLYSMLVTSKRYGSTFYLTTTTAMKMIGTTSRDTVQKAIKDLVKDGFVEYRRKGEIDKAQSRETGQVRCKPNKYRLLLPEISEGEPYVEVSNEQSVVDVALMLCDAKEIRRYVKRREYDSKWRDKGAV
ncbi:TOTE conflict system archaeo-eukaryotic primase domain-containing protein [Heyndrickxia sp. MSNUG]|uniref:TOTE conflict system archaeo-eukaryotic primase domain-containing protein n=1 Tax=Heyndrickxia sp. MSNUG TaxID=3136677 RepID=UPI003C2E81DC